MGTGRYEVLRLLGRGGMAQVLEAVAVSELGIRRRVAIKRLLPHLALDEDVQHMFFEEARIASLFHHGSIVQVLDFGDLDGGYFIAMEFIDGLNARRATDLGRKAGALIPEGVALHVICSLADALRYVHQLRDDDGVNLDVVHRDVTPANVLFSWEGDVKLSDFGIALERHRGRHTAAGVVRGKAAFMSPEQLRAEPLTGAADVWALGATLHCLLTGESPSGPDLDLARIMRGAPVEIDSSLPADIAHLITRCTSPKAAARPTAEEVAAMAGRLVADRRVGDSRGALRSWLGTLRTESSSDEEEELDGMVILPDETKRSYTVTLSDTAGEQVRAALARITQPPPAGETTAVEAAEQEIEATLDVPAVARALTLTASLGESSQEPPEEVGRFPAPSGLPPLALGPPTEPPRSPEPLPPTISTSRRRGGLVVALIVGGLVVAAGSTAGLWLGLGQTNTQEDPELGLGGLGDSFKFSSFGLLDRPLPDSPLSPAPS